MCWMICWKLCMFHNITHGRFGGRRSVYVPTRMLFWRLYHKARNARKMNTHITPLWMHKPPATVARKSVRSSHEHKSQVKHYHFSEQKDDSLEPTSKLHQLITERRIIITNMCHTDHGKIITNIIPLLTDSSKYYPFASYTINQIRTSPPET